MIFSYFRDDVLECISCVLKKFKAAKPFCFMILLLSLYLVAIKMIRNMHTYY